MEKYVDRRIKGEWDMKELYPPVHSINLEEEQKVIIEKIIKAIDEKSFNYYTPSGYAVDMGDVVEVVKRECGKEEIKKKNTCKWEKYRIIDGIQTYKTTCLHEFKEEYVKKYKFCPYCGRGIEEVGENHEK